MAGAKRLDDQGKAVTNISTSIHDSVFQSPKTFLYWQNRHWPLKNQVQVNMYHIKVTLGYDQPSGVFPLLKCQVKKNAGPTTRVGSDLSSNGVVINFVC